jgi:SET domain-containing protein
MLLVRVRVAPSPIHGLGVFAAEAVPRGAAVWRFTPGFDLECAPDTLESLQPLQRERLLHYGYCDRSSGSFVLCCDDARFLNHAAEPNLVNEPDGTRHGVDRAARDIAVGEELTVDYHSFER